LKQAKTLLDGWHHAAFRGEGRVRLSITGKVREVLLSVIVSRSLLSLRGDAGANGPVFVSRKCGALSERTVMKW
jgi:hypothetical protein